LLGRGVPVVTANKALVAAHGPELTALAARRGTAFRYEASALAGVPFLGALAARPLVSDVQRFTAVVNGTSNFILSRLEREGHDFASALADAQALGLTEPDPSRDLDGRDAADKLSLLASVFGWGVLSRSRIDVQGINDIAPDDLAIAAALGGTIKPVVHAALTASGVSAFIGPALVPARHPLAALSGTLAGIQLSGWFISDLYFSGPGAGPDITAATILDDAVEAVSSGPKVRLPVRSGVRIATPAAAPATEWLVRARFPGFVPEAAAVTQVFSSAHFNVLHVTEPIGGTRWVRLAPATRESLDAALARVQTTHRIQCLALRAL
jgi:homoserine dehydrogenase